MSANTIGRSGISVVVIAILGLASLATVVRAEDRAKFDRVPSSAQRVPELPASVRLRPVVTSNAFKELSRQGAPLPTAATIPDRVSDAMRRIQGSVRVRVLVSDCSFDHTTLSVRAQENIGMKFDRSKPAKGGAPSGVSVPAPRPQSFELRRLADVGTDLDLVYEGREVPMGSYSILGSFAGAPCPGGSWSRPIARLDHGSPRAEVTLRYTVPRTRAEINAGSVSTLMEAILAGVRLRVNNYTPRNRRGTWYQAGDSFMALPEGFGGTRFPFDVPEFRFGIFRYYVKDLEARSTMIDVAPGPGHFLVTIPFESAGVEVKGHCWGTDAAIDVKCPAGNDSTAPDGHLDNLRVALQLTPVFWGGEVALEVTGVSATGDISARGIAAPVVAALRSHIEGTVFPLVEQEVRKALSGRAFMNATAEAMRTLLDLNRVGDVQSVSMSERSLVVEHVPPRSS